MTAQDTLYPRYPVRPPEPIEIGPDAIPALVVRPEGEEPRPAALVQHGYGASKADLLPLGQFLASYGFVALLPDAWGHGDRFPTSGPSWMSSFSADFIVEVLRHTVDDMGVALTALLERPDVRPGGALLAGFSLGAVASLIVGAEDPRATGTYSISGSPVPDLAHLLPAGLPGPGPEAEHWARAHDCAAIKPIAGVTLQPSRPWRPDAFTHPSVARTFESGSGASRTRRDARAMSALRDEAESLCST